MINEGASELVDTPPGVLGAEENIAELTINERTFGIRAADVDDQRNSASMLINKMYAWRGYAGNHQVGNDPNRITLTASDKDGVIGTLSLGMDSDIGMLADQTFKDLIDPLRANCKVCEFIKFAIDPAVKSKAVLASLFHVAFIYARDLHNCSHIIIEVQLRHRRFYETMLGFTMVGDARQNARVDVPSVMLQVSTAYGTEQIAKLAGNTDNPGNDRSLFPHFFSPREEAGIIDRLKKLG